MFKRPHYIAWTVVLLTVLVLFSIPSRYAAQLKLAVSGFFLPLFGLSGTAHHLTERGETVLIPRTALLDRIQQLQRENDEFRLRNLQCTQLAEENAALRDAVGWQKSVPWKLKLARVILRDPADWWRTLQIDVGQRDGISTNMPVLTSEGLVGKVNQVAYSHSQVVLLGDSNCRVAAQIETNGPKVHGIVTTAPATVLDPSIVSLTFIDRQAVLEPGLKVVTSGLSGTYPTGIPIGQILDASSVGFGMYTEARVKLAANLNDLDYVWVMCQ